MRRLKILALLAALCAATPARADAVIGQPAPAFTATDTTGKAQTLSDYRGKTVVLEWTNPDCPYVHKHYDSGNMQSLQKEETGKGVVWFSIVSSAQGREGFMSPGQANAYMKAQNTAATARILDPDGTIGRLYGATATPHMFVIDKAGTLVYKGAIDNMPTTRPDSIKIASNYVRAALDDLAANRPVATAVTQAYGCAVKYKDE